MIEDFHGRGAVVTGGGSGIGRATSIALAREGAAVAVADRDGDRAAAVAAEIQAAGGAAVGVRCDVSSDHDMAALHATAFDRLGRVDIVMNNVGVLVLGKPEDIPVDAWARVVDVNLLSVARSLPLFLPGLLAQGSGHIVNTASTAGLFAYSHQRLPYSATKAAIIALSEALALYSRPLGVGVTCLCPGPVHTNIGEHIKVYGDVGTIKGPPLPGLEPEAVAQQVVDAIRADTFLLPTHPEVHDILVRRAADPEAFLRDQIVWLQGE